MSEIKDYLRWYDDNAPKYKFFGEKVERLISELLDIKEIPTHSVSFRLKSKKSFLEKSKNYTDSDKNVMDIAGIRIICYIESEVDSVRNVIRTEFEIDEENSIDKSDELGIEKVGYQSIHFIASFNDTRRNLPENIEYKDLVCEIQIRTLLQHAWAEISHDRYYKFSGVLPNSIKRRFNLVAGSLELLDNEFQSISEEIDNYPEEIKESTEKGDFNIKIDSISLYEFIKENIGELNNISYRDFIRGSGDNDIIEELNNYDIFTLYDLKKILSDKLIEMYNKAKISPSFVGLLRSLMILKNPNKYFSKSYKGDWTSDEEADYAILRILNKDIEEAYKDYNISINPDLTRFY